jgi:transcription antitermination factor NusG
MTKLNAFSRLLDRPKTETEDPDAYHWYAMRVFNGRVFRIRDEIESAGMETYMAMKTVDLMRDGALVYEQKQIVPSLLFVRTDLRWLLGFKHVHFSDILLYRSGKGGPPAPIPDSEMDMFMFVTSAGKGADVELLGNDFSCFKKGERVRVVEGIYKGAEGIVKRIRRDRKLLVAVNGVAVVAISNIPVQFLEKI